MIEVEQGLILSFTIAFRIHSSSSDSCDDHLTITDGDGTTLMEKSCGSFPYIMIGGKTIDSPLPVPIISKSNIINLVFKTSSYNSGPGWNISWSAVTPGECKKWRHLPSLSCYERYSDHLYSYHQAPSAPPKPLLAILALSPKARSAITRT